MTFSDDHTLLATEDRGDLLHSQLSRLDSVWAFATDGSAAPRRFVALGRDQTSVNAGEDNEPHWLARFGWRDVRGGYARHFEQLSQPARIPDSSARDNQVWEIVKRK